MKLQHVLEARYAGDNRPLWLKDALFIAKNNMDRASNEDEWEFWDDYKNWLNSNTKILSQIFNTIKADRDHSLERFEDPDPIDREGRSQWNERREVHAELWSSNSSHEEFPIFKAFIQEQRTKEQIDYAMMVGNEMFDLLGGLRDER